MQADTVIGIVGAVVLVSVMVGVFAYEYNNVEEPVIEPSDAEIMAEKKAMFNATFPGLNPDGDLDGDQVPNWNETDLDNDGINNTDDDEFDFMTTYQFTGSVSQGLSTPVSSPAGFQSPEFVAQQGIFHIKLELTHDERVAQDQQIAPLEVTITYPGGTATATPTTAGGSTTYTYEFMTDVAPGTYQVRVQPFEAPGGVIGGDPGTSFAGFMTFHYAIV